MFKFSILTKDKKTKARVGRIETPHGVINTPCFVPVGTQATVKGLTPDDLKTIGAELLFGNTYHLHLRPGEETVKEFGGLAKFMSWDGPTITDSGGFQVFSLGRRKKQNRTQKDAENNSALHIFNAEEEPILVKITENGVTFRSHIDGSLHEFTPEESIKIQKKLGADIILAFDECAPHPSTYEYTKEAMVRTHEWAVRCLNKHASTSEESKATSEVLRSDSSDGGLKQVLYGIVQGGIFEDLRKVSAKFISSQSFDGIAVGGVSVGESKQQMRDVLDWVEPFLPEEKPRHLLGIGEIDDIFDAVDKGMDTFDCVIPTRFGRYGIVFVSPPEGSAEQKFRITISKSIYAKSKEPLDANCSCFVCKKFTRGYINHLFRVQELLGYRLASYHNMYFIVNLVKQIREAILEERFSEFKKAWLS